MTDREIKVKESYLDQLASEIRALTERAEKAERELAHWRSGYEEMEAANHEAASELAAVRGAEYFDVDRERKYWKRKAEKAERELAAARERIAELKRRLAICEGFGSRPGLRPITPRARASAEDPPVQGGGT